MKRQSSFNTRDLRKTMPRAKHNLSYRNLMSAPFGALVPFMVQEFPAGSSIELGLEHQTRARALPRPAFTRLREHFDYFFVPFSQLYRAFDNFRTQQDNQSSMLFENAYTSSPKELPYFKINKYLVSPSERPAIGPNEEKDAAGFGAVYGTNRLLDLLMYGVNNSLVDQRGDYPSEENNLRYNPFRCLAYQKIYFDYYRNDKYEGNYTQFYNIDDINDVKLISTDRAKQFTLLRYRWRKKDYFTQVTPDVLPTPQQFNRAGFDIAQLSLAGGSSEYMPQSVNNKLGGHTPAVVPSVGVPNPDNVTQPIIDSSQGTILGFGVDSVSPMGQGVPNHRWATAIDKLLRRMYAAKSDFSSQMLAIFGIAPVEGRHGRVSHIGGYSQILGISDVDNNTNTNTTSSPVYGKINQYGDTKSFRYKTQEDGIIMGIYSTSMENDYSSLRVSRHNLKLTPFDFFIPQFSAVGKQSLFSVEYQKYYYDTSSEEYKHMPLGVVGFIPRYDEYRSHTDEVHGAFDAGYDTAYVAPVNADMRDGHLYLNIENLIYKPSMVDRIFAVNADGTEGTDQFQLNLYNKIKCISPVPLRVEL